MNDLISRSALQKSMADVVFKNVPVEHQPYMQVVCDAFAHLVIEAPAVDAEPVRRGKYGFVGMDMMAGSRAFYFGTCSECHERINFEAKHKNYCPNCGAKMDAEVEGCV